MEHLVVEISGFLWSIFLPLVVVISIYMSIKFFSKLQGKLTKKNAIKMQQIIGPVSISLGAMIGTGAIIGVLGSTASLYIAGQNYVEAIVGWALVGIIVLLPLAYMETITAKVTQLSPKQYIAKFLSPTAATIYAASFCLMCILGFGGFQFQGINSTVTILTSFGGAELDQMQRFLFIVMPLFIFVVAVVMTRKQALFINVLSVLISFAVVIYIIFLGIFIFNTSDHISVFFSNMATGMQNPVTAFLGVPLGLIISFQRIIQTAEPGLGALAMSSLESDSKPRPAALVSLFTSLVTVLIGVLLTSYVISYGNATGTIDLSNNDSLFLLDGLFHTAYNVTGMFGVITLTVFTIFSGITTLLSSFYFINLLFDLKPNTEIAIYAGLSFIAGVLATFGGSIIFEIVNLLLFVVASINIAALFVFMRKRYKGYEVS